MIAAASREEVPVGVLARVVSYDLNVSRVVLVKGFFGQALRLSQLIMLPPAALCSFRLAHGPNCSRHQKHRKEKTSGNCKPAQ
jgi:hypothetical protein